MAMTPYSGDTSVIGKLGTTPQERGLTTQQFKDKFDEGLKAFVEWFNETHNGEINEHMAENVSHGGIYHKNLLHNWDWRKPVNHKGLTSYSNVMYTIDRWLWTFAAATRSITINSGYITIKNTSGTTGVLAQKLEALEPSTYTLSVLFNDGTVESKTLTWDGSTLAESATSFGALSLRLVDGFPTFAMGIGAGKSINVKAVKLEKGQATTLSADSAADYGEELLLCKRYYRLWTTEAARTEALKEVGLMRIPNPTLGTINIGGTTHYYASADL